MFVLLKGPITWDQTFKSWMSVYSTNITRPHDFYRLTSIFFHFLLSSRLRFEGLPPADATWIRWRGFRQPARQQHAHGGWVTYCLPNHSEGGSVVQAWEQKQLLGNIEEKYRPPSLCIWWCHSLKYTHTHTHFWVICPHLLSYFITHYTPSLCRTAPSTHPQVEFDWYDVDSLPLLK